MQQDKALLFCHRWLPAWTGNRPELLVEFYAETIYYRDPAKPEGITGKKNLLTYLQKLLAKYPHWIWQVVEVFPWEGGFILKWEAKLASDKPSFFGLDIVEIKDEKISRNEVFFDTSVLFNS